MSAKPTLKERRMKELGIAIDPEYAWGEPRVRAYGCKVSVLVERFKQGETMAAVAHDYGMGILELEDAVRYYLYYGNK
jgi:uncharacterized protein (DUF433 family)